MSVIDFFPPVDKAGHQVEGQEDQAQGRDQRLPEGDAAFNQRAEQAEGQPADDRVGQRQDNDPDPVGLVLAADRNIFHACGLPFLHHRFHFPDLLHSFFLSSGTVFSPGTCLYAAGKGDGSGRCKNSRTWEKIDIYGLFM